MATVYLHIGLPKTGTTAIQSFLAKNKKALRKHSACFPDFGYRYLRRDHYVHIDSVRNAHFLVKAWESLVTDTPNKTYLSVLDQLEELGKQYDKIILSDESLWLFGDLCPDAWTVLKSDLEKRGLKLCAIAYLRRQDNFALSYYRQMIKSAGTGLSFYDYMDNVFKDKYQLDYFSHLEFLSGILGRENVFFRVYEKGQFQGDEHNIYSDFLDILGIPLKDGFVLEKEMYNASLDDSLLELKRILNQLPKPDCYNYLLSGHIRAMLNDRDPEKLHEKTSLFHPGDQSAYLESFAESNSRFAREYLGREDGTLFYDDTDMELPECHVSTEDLLYDVILYYAKIVQTLEKQQKQMEKQLETQMKTQYRSLRAEFVDVRECVFLYRLRRKYRHLKNKFKARFGQKQTD